MPEKQTQPDPWEQAAKNFKAQPQGESAPSGNEDWKLWQENGSPQSGYDTQSRFDELTKMEPHGTTHTGNKMADNAITAASNFGSGVIGLATPLVHPIQTMQALAHPIESLKNLSNALQGPNSAETIEQGIPGLLMALRGSTAELPKIGKYQSSIVPAAEANAERLAKAILPQEGITPNHIRSIMAEAPHVREYAMRTSNPLRTIPEGIKAAEGVAQEGLQHYRTNFADPFSNERISMSSVPEYQGPVGGEGRYTTLGDIDKRISDINDVIRGATLRAKSGGAELTALERQGLEGEAGKLRQILYRELSKRTGVPAEEIQNMREGYGGQYALKNALESGHYNRLTRSGMTAQGGGSSIYPSKSGIIDRAITAIRGGPEAIANRQFRSRMAAFEPEPPKYPTPMTRK